MSTPAAASSRAGDRRAGLERALEQLVLGALPVALTAWLAFAALRFHWVAEDFSQAYYPAALRLLHGGNPYAVTHDQIVAGAAFVYPALSAAALAPFALVSRGLGDHLYTLLCFACVLGSLWAARVDDWRAWGISLLWFPIIIAWQGENLTAPLMLLVALAWRHRDRPVVAGLITAAAISLKPFVWPLGLWLLATRRWKAACWALAWGVVFNLLAWGIVGFDEIHTYLRLSGQVTDALWRGGYSMLAVAHHLGFSRGVGYILLVLVSAAIGAGVLYTGAVRRDDRAAMTLAVALMLAASPLVWIHYFALLLLPLALARPRFGVAWAVPLAMWALPSATAVAGWQIALAWLVALTCFTQALRASPVRRVRPDATRDPSPALQILRASS